MWPNFVHIQNYVDGDRPLGQTWSLAVEEHFYLLLPILLSALVMRKLIWNSFPMFAVATLAISFVFRLTLMDVPYSPQTHIFATHIRIDNLMLGVLLAWLAKVDHPVLAFLMKHRFLMSLVAIGCIAIPTFFERSDRFVFTVGYSLFAVGYAIIVVLAYKTTLEVDTSRLTLFHKAGILVGQCSYSIYLWMAIMAGRPLEFFASRVKFDSSLAYWVFLIIYFIWASTIGIIMHRIVEIPINAFRNKLYPRAVTT
jgi:peptidoglycan/LPS O-acetylase OafA/YrhL